MRKRSKKLQFTERLKITHKKGESKVTRHEIKIGKGRCVLVIDLHGVAHKFDRAGAQELLMAVESQKWGARAEARRLDVIAMIKEGLKQ